MKIKLGDIVKAQNSYEELMRTKMPPKAAYWLMKAGRVIDREIETFMKTRDRLIKEIGTHDEEKDTYTVPPEKQAEFTEQMDELLEQELDVNIKPLTQEIVEQGIDKISPRVMTDLWFIFDEE